ncbi:MAG: carbohydrate-binding protein, partial [Bacteroidales bacterium]|nr:carbohydrate-binding protein [Bacteroidales bacterium]
MTKLKLTQIVAVVIIAIYPIMGLAWQGMPTPALHVDGNKLKDPTGKEVLLHGFMQPTSNWFNGQGKWYSNPRDWEDANDVAQCLNFMNEMADLMSDTTPRYNQNHGWYASFVRLNTDDIGGWNSQSGLTDANQFNAWINNFIVPYAEHLSSRGLYLVLSAVGPINTPNNGTHNAGMEEQQRLLTFWSTVANAPGVKNAENIMFELMNEPVDIESSPGNGDWGNHQNKYFSAFTKWIQPVIDTIRSTGSNNIIWVPTLEWQGSPYQWDLYPFSGTNIGVACHYYPAYGGVFDDPVRVQSLWDRQYKPAADRWPMIITEMFWTPFPNDPGNLVNGHTEGFGNAIKKAMDNQGNVSYMVGFIGDLLESLNDSRPADCNLAPREGAQSYFQWLPSYVPFGPDDGTPKLEYARVTEENPKQLQLVLSHAANKENSFTGFTVTIDNQVVDIDSVVAGDTTNMLLVNLKNNVLNNNEIALSYSNGNVWSIYGKCLADFTDIPVNNQLNGAPPKILELSTNEHSNILIARFSKKMNIPIDLSVMTLTVQYDEKIDLSVLSSSFYNEDSTLLMFTLSDTVYADYTLALSYSGNNIASSDGGLLQSFTDRPIKNNSTGMNFSVTSGKIEADGYSVILEFTKPLAIIVGMPDDFAIEVNGKSAAYKSLYVVNNTIRFTLENNLHYGDTLVIDYIPGNITATDMGKLELFTGLNIYNPLPEPTWQKIPGKIQAEKYNLQSGTRTENTSDSGGGLNVGWIDSGDWLEYAIENNTTDSRFEISFRLASNSGDGKIDFYLDNKKKSVVSVPNTGSWQTWKSVDKIITVPPGKHYMKLIASTGGFNINYMEISLPGGTGTESIIDEGIHIYPNPVCSEMVIKASAFKHHKIEVLDITGKIIQSW